MKANKVMITGAGGFLGRHLCSYMNNSCEVIAVDLAGVVPVPDVNWQEVSDDNTFSDIFTENNPDIVIHAAFKNKVSRDEKHSDYLKVALGIDEPFFATIAENKAKLLLISSSSLYGNADGAEIIDENCAVAPVSIYGLAKYNQENLARYYALKGLELGIIRLFNLIGPGQKIGMLFPDWVSQAVEIHHGKKESMDIFHYQTKRDFVDVRDACRAINLFADNFKNDKIFNVSSGDVVYLYDVLLELKSLVNKDFEVNTRQNLPDSTDVKAQRGDYSLIKKHLNWSPEYKWQESLRDLWLEMLEA